jgi:hypothetical protein
MQLEPITFEGAVLFVGGGGSGPCSPRSLRRATARAFFCST